MMPVCLGMQQRPREQVPIRCRACHRSVEAINQTGTGIEQAPLQMIGKRFEVEHDCVTRLQALAHLDHVVGAGSPHEMRCVWPAAGGPCPWEGRLPVATPSCQRCSGPAVAAPAWACRACIPQRSPSAPVRSSTQHNPGWARQGWATPAVVGPSREPSGARDFSTSSAPFRYRATALCRRSDRRDSFALRHSALRKFLRERLRELARMGLGDASRCRAVGNGALSVTLRARWAALPVQALVGRGVVALRDLGHYTRLIPAHAYRLLSSAGGA